MTAEVATVVLRPKKIRRVAWACAIGLVIVFTIVGLLLGRDADRRVLPGVRPGGHGRSRVPARGRRAAADPAARTADAAGIDIRNVVMSHHFDWSDVHSVSFPDGAAWARLELPEDEYISIMAVQAVDREYAVTSVRALRELHKAAQN